MMNAVVGRGFAILLAFGWLAESLAAPNGDIEASVAAYENQSWDDALQRLETATETLGDRPELMYNRGLILLATGDKEGARSGFERGTESEHLEVRSSAHFELGNLDFDQGEEWSSAIDHYIECLKAKPDHDKAKWNLELALLKQKEAEEKKKQDQEDKDQEEKQDQEKNDGQDGKDEPPSEDQENQEDQKEPPPSDTDSESPPEQEEGSSTGNADEGTGEPPPEPPESSETGGADGQPPPAAPEEEPANSQNAAAQPQAVERVDISKSLEQLDEQDNFMLGIPSGSNVPVDKDW